MEEKYKTNLDTKKLIQEFDKYNNIINFKNPYTLETILIMQFINENVKIKFNVINLNKKEYDNGWDLIEPSNNIVICSMRLE